MTRIGLMSDTHAYLHPKILDFIRDCDEIWHAGDIGNLETANELEKIKPLKAVYGNIDGQSVRLSFPEIQIFSCEQVKVLMIHIGGYPGRYEKKALDLIRAEKPKLFISGHSHILKVIYDDKNRLLHINPGSAGKYGLHNIITAVRFVIDGDRIKDLEICEVDR
jgi:putative phosphoesterase